MTYSYSLRAWAVEQISRGVLGRGAIADACAVAPKTITSWVRASNGRGPTLLATHREYHRSIAILLFERFPKHIDQVAELLQVTPRMILEWRMQVRSIAHNGELTWATRLALVYFHNIIPDYFAVSRSKLNLTKLKYPDSSDIESMIFAVYDNILRSLIGQAGYGQYKRNSRSTERDFDKYGIQSKGFTDELSTSSKLKRINGAHRYRGAVVFKDEHVDFDAHLLSLREEYKHLPSNLMLLSESKLLGVGELHLNLIFSYLRRERSSSTRYKIRFNDNWIKWSLEEALSNYIISVDMRHRLRGFSFARTT